MPLMLALGVAAGPAHAKKNDAKIRLKYSTDLVNVAVDKASYDGEELDDAEQRITTLSLLDHRNRFEATYMLGNSIEVGGILGMSQQRGTIGDEEAATQRHAQLMVTGAYNLGVGNGMRVFFQPLVGIDQSATDPGEDTEQKLRYLLVGADVGLRLKLNKKTTFDVAAEALRGGGKATVNGESDDKLKLTQTNAGIRLGLSVRI
jgi:hypothetical protein